MGQALDGPHHIVREVADCAGPELPQFLDGRRSLAAQPLLQIGNRVPDGSPAMPADPGKPLVDLSVLEAPRRARFGTDEGVSRPRWL